MPQSKTRRRTVLLTLPLATAALALLWPDGPAEAAPTFLGATEPRASGRGARPAALGPASGSRQVPPGAIARGWYGAPVGTRLEFAVATRQGIELASTEQGGGVQGGAAQMDGTLELTILESAPQEIVAALRFATLEIDAPVAPESGSDDLARVSEQLTRTSLVRFAPSGRLIGLRFPEDYDFHARNQLRSVLHAFRFVVEPDDGCVAWTTEERDETGVQSVEYQRFASGPDDLELQRRKLGYLSMAGGGNASDACAAEVEGRSTARLSRAVGWLVEAEVEERAVFRVDGTTMRATTTQSGSWQLVSSTRVPVAELPRFDSDGDWSPAASGGEDALAEFTSDEEARWRRELEGLRMTDLVGYLDGLVQSGQNTGEDYDRTWEEISWLCRLDSEAVAELAGLIRSGRYDDVFASGLLTALGNADTAEAQVELTAIHRGERSSVELRAAATVALVQASRPTPASLDALWNTALDSAAPPELGSTSLLVFGALAGRKHSTGSDGRPALDLLLAAEAECRERGTLENWLHALGNSGAPRALDRALAYLEHADANLRAAAAAAMRGRIPASAVRRFVRRLAVEVDARVRVRIVEGLGEVVVAVPAVSVRAALSQSALRDDAAAVREAALVALAARPDAETVEVLRRAAAGDAEKRVREVAARLLAGS